MDKLDEYATTGIKRGKKVFDGFKKFVLRGNVVDMAVGIVIGAAFSGVVTALVENVLTPFIAALIRVPDFSKLSFAMNGSEILYGNFFNSLISFLIVAFTIYFFVVSPINTLVAKAKREEPADPTDKKCPECKSEIPVDATRCKFCAITLK